MKLSVIIPVYNERATFPTLLQKVQAVDVDKEVIIVDNCSTDGTREWLKDLESEADGERLRIVFQPQNYGKGMSVRKGIELARGEYLVVQDADLEYSPPDLLKLLRAAEEGQRAVVYGSRFLTPTEAGQSIFGVGRVGLTWLFNGLYDQRITDVSTCYKMIRRESAQSLRLCCSGFDLDFEISARLARAGYQIYEVPISYQQRTAAQGKKLRLRDGWAALWALVRCRA